MPHKVVYDPEGGCIKAWNSGRFDEGVAREIAAGVTQALSTSDCKRVLIDLRESELALSIVDLYRASRMASAAGIPRSIKRAIIVPKENLVAYDLFKMVSQNIGKGVRAFTDPDEAIRWLMGQTAKMCF